MNLSDGTMTEGHIPSPPTTSPRTSQWHDKGQRRTFRKERPRRYRWTLWLGLGLWLSCSAILWLIELLGGTVDEQNFLNDMIKMLATHIGFGGIFFMIALFGPFTEELAFRLWGIGRLWTYFLSAVLVLLFAGSELGFVLGTVAAAGIMLCACLVKDISRRTSIMIWLTSATFALCHTSGYEGLSLSMVLGLVSIFGMALVLDYLTIHHSWGFAVLLHMLNNGIACFGMRDEINALHQPHDTIAITTEAYDPTVTPGFAEAAVSQEDANILTFTGPATELAKDMIHSD